MAVYNDAKYLPYSVKSILKQDYPDFEFLIIDDGSSDNTEEVIHNFKDTRIVYKKINHRGLAGALNYGMKISSGDWIARLDADDLNTSNRISLQLTEIKKEGQADVLASRSVYFNNNKKVLFLINPPEDDGEIKKFLNLHNPINHSSVAFKKSSITNNNGYDENFRCYEDFELWFRLRHKLTFKIIPEYLVYTRLRKNSLTAKESKSEIYKMLFMNAKKNFTRSKDSPEALYWNNILFWIEYFYGNKINARKYFIKGMTLKKMIAFLNSFLPEKAFLNLTELRLRQRIISKTKNLSKFKKELDSLL